MLRYILCLFIALFISTGVAYAGIPASDSAAPVWTQLNPAEQKVLAPLAGEWNTYPAKKRNHLIKVADQYPKMTPQQQARLNERLPKWAALSMEQREKARENFKKIKQLPPDKRIAVKQQLKQEHAAKKAAALRAVKPVSAAAPATPAPTTTPVSQPIKQ